ncbi:MAG: hypothetical protein AMS24_00580 [Chlamydiae bacterium SM23_39]|nr:MAG: hypothetical protein AMS24_00580 [Chlamydiae bacterium SM23_39]
MKVIYGKREAKKNMDFDKKLFKSLKFNTFCILHFYEWENPSITYGIFEKPENFFCLEKIKQMKIDLTKRPTGGGIVFHMWDMAFSFLMPSNHKYFFLNPLKNYHFVNGIVLKAVKEYFNLKNLRLKNFFSLNRYKSFCMANTTKYDLVYKGRKIAGAAQRKGKDGYLHQGSISLAFPDKKYLDSFFIKKDILNAILENSYPLILKGEDLDLTKKMLKELLIKYFKKTLC